MKKVIALILVLVLCVGLVTVVSAEDKARAVVEQSVPNTTMMLKDNWHRLTDKADAGEMEKWYEGFPSKGETITLPHQPGHLMTSVLWYYNRFTPDFQVEDGQRVLITFQGWSYYTKIWFNGTFIGENEGAWNRFTFDVTDYIREGEENLIAVRSYTAGDFGTLRDQTQSTLPVRNSIFQHIQQPVYVSVVPEISMKNVHVDTKYESGNVDVKVILNNPGDQVVPVEISGEITPNNSDVLVDRRSATVDAVPGLSEHILTMTVEDFHAWSPDDPYLYSAKISAKAYDSACSESTVVQVGFKDFRIDEDGYFMLNGERFYVKCMHTNVTGNNVKRTAGTMEDAEREFAILDYYKACGYNMVRFLGSPGDPNLFDHCDRIGLLVYEEQTLAWLQDSEDGEKLIRRDLAQLMERDRNHVSLGIMGMLNETYDNRVDFEGLNNFRASVNALDVVRAYDSDVLVFLGSGRWDYDASIGSASNPGSSTWNVYLGDEGVMSEDGSYGGKLAMGDIHEYPHMPLNKEVREKFKNFGEMKNAVIISEGGVGSQVNIVSSLRTWQQESKGNFAVVGANRGVQQVDPLYDLYDTYNMSSAYGTPELLLRDTQKLSAELRGLMFDFIRSNHKINGFSLTMSYDAGGRGEGVLETTTDFKDGHYEALTDGWADTRWCLNVDHYNVYNTQGLDVEIYLSDLGKLEVKEYTARFTVTGEEGTVWEKDVPVTPLRDKNGNYISAVMVLDENIPLEGLKSGEYRINAYLVGTGISRTRTFWVTDAADMPKVSGTVYTVGFSNEAMDLMKNAGLTCIELDYENIPAGCTILLGGTNLKNRVLQAVYRSAKETGSVVVGVNPDAFGNTGTANLPYGSATIVKKYNNWLYHYDTMMFDNMLSDGLQNNCIISSLYYEDVYSNSYFDITDDPVDTLALNLYIGEQNGSNGGSLVAAVVAGAYEWGEGILVTHTFGIMDSIGMPVADRMMLNLINYALTTY